MHHRLMSNQNEQQYMLHQKQLFFPAVIMKHKLTTGLFPITLNRIWICPNSGPGSGLGYKEQSEPRTWGLSYELCLPINTFTAVAQSAITSSDS